MSLVRYQPWNTLNRLRADQFRNDLSQFFNPNYDSSSESTPEAAMAASSANSALPSDWVPAVDVKETENEFVLHADIPGVNPKDIDVQMENGLLTIKGQRETDKTESKDGYTRVERSYGQFARRFSLPDTADADKINAKYDQGVLRITIPKHIKVQPRKIEVEH